MTNLEPLALFDIVKKIILVMIVIIILMKEKICHQTCVDIITCSIKFI